jgi:hypothetical protein
MLTRRTAVAGLGLAGAALAAEARAAPPTKLRIRKDLSTLSPTADDLVALRTAIGKMGGNGPLSWNAQVRLHARHDLGHHTSWRFLPWHRMQLVYFERIVARLSGHADFALPYWNWQDNDTIPEALFDTPLLDASRWARPGDHIADFMREHDYHYRDASELIGYLVGSPTAPGAVCQSGHNIIHMFVGGNMGAIDTAVYDPLFWFHHANVDRIWWALSQRYPETTAAGQYPPGWAEADLRGYVDEKGRPVPTVLAGTTKDTRAFGYVYDVKAPVLVGGAAPPLVGGPRNVEKAPPSRIIREFTMERTGPAGGRIFVPPEVLANLKGEGPLMLTARGDAQVTSNGHKLSIVSRPKAGGEAYGRTQVFALPMIGMGAMPWGHEIDLSELIPRHESAALKDGVWLEATATRLDHLRADQFPEPELDAFSLNYSAERS